MLLLGQAVPGLQAALIDEDDTGGGHGSVEDLSSHSLPVRDMCNNAGGLGTNGVLPQQVGGLVRHSDGEVGVESGLGIDDVLPQLQAVPQVGADACNGLGADDVLPHQGVLAAVYTDDEGGSTMVSEQGLGTVPNLPQLLDPGAASFIPSSRLRDGSNPGAALDL